MKREEFLKKLPGLVRNYRPSGVVRDHMKLIRILIIVGPSGAGKTTLINNLSIPLVLSDNTRPPRPGEVEGEDFYFRSDYDQLIEEIENGQFVQVAVDGGGDLKSTKASSYPKGGDAVKDVVADVVPAFRALGFNKSLTAFITPPTYEEWMRRMKSHNLNKDQFASRIAEAARSFKFALNDEETHFILSDRVKAATHQIEELMAGKIDKNREEQARDAAEQIKQKLDETRLV